MDGLWFVLLISLLPGAGNFAGGMIAEFTKSSPRLLNWALHAASGIVIAIVAVELIPEARRALEDSWIAVAFSAGGFSYLLLQSLTERLQRVGGGKSRTGMWMIYVAVAVDLTSDGLMIGSGSAASVSLAIVLASGQILADLPEGYAAVANFRSKGVARRNRFLLSASFFLFVMMAALLSYLVLRDASEFVKMAALMIAAGLLTVAALEDMLAEAHEAIEDNRRSVIAFICGFALFTFMSSGIESLLTG